MSNKTRQGVLRQGTSEQSVFEDRADDSGGLSASYGEVKNVSRMTMDFRVVKLDHGGVISDESVVTNTILLYQKAKDASFGVRLNGKSLGTLSTFGLGGAVGYGSTTTEVDARHAAVRMLIERSVMEVLGKSYRLPYWRCLSKKVDTADTEEEKFVVKPNETDKFHLSNEYIKILTQTGNAEEYPDSMIDAKSLADTSVINAIKRYFERDDYLDKETRLVKYFKRPDRITKSSNYIAYIPGRLDEIRKLIDDSKKEKQKTNKKTESLQDITNAKIRLQWLADLEKRLPKDTKLECGQYYFVKDNNYNKPLPGNVNNEMNPYLYAQVDTKMCLFNKLLSAYNSNNAKDLYNVYGIYGVKNNNITEKSLINNADFFATLWVNLPIQINARWKY